MRPSSRSTALDAALSLMASEWGGSITLDGVARAAGITKAGLMYHFPTRESLMLAIVDHAASRLEEQMIEILDKPPHTATPAERMRAYVEVAAHGSASRAEYAIFTEAAYRPELTEPWTRRLTAWFEVPPETDLLTRARLLAVRLAADGLWAAEATGVFPPAPAERGAVVALLQSLTVPPGETPDARTERSTT